MTLSPELKKSFEKASINTAKTYYGVLIRTLYQVVDENLVNPEIKKRVIDEVTQIPKDADKLRVYIKEKLEPRIAKLILDQADKYWQKKVDKKQSKEKDEDNVLELSFYDDGRYLYEEVYDKENRYRFVKYDPIKDDWEFVTEIETEYEKIIPIEGEEINLGVVKLPKNIKRYASLELLDEQIQNFIYKWLDVDAKFIRLATYNLRFSWLYDQFQTLNYLRALGDTGSGKSRFLDTIGTIHYKPMMVSGALSPASIFRLIHKWGGTLLIDEGDQKDSDEANMFIKIMNCGYEKDRSVMRCDNNDNNKLQFFNVFCPKVITTRRRFEDKATEARCITQIMIQTSRQNIIEILTKSFYEEAEDIRQQLLYYRLSEYRKIDNEAGLKIDLSQYEPRLRQISRSFLSLFHHNTKEINNFKDFLTLYQTELIEERADTFEGIIINSIVGLIMNNWEIEEITPTDIANFANEQHHYNNDIKARSVSKSCKTIGLEFHPKKINGINKRRLVPNIDLLKTLAKRYVSTGTSFINKLQDMEDRLPVERGNAGNVGNDGNGDPRKIEKVPILTKMVKNAKKGGVYDTSVTNVTNVTKNSIGNEGVKNEDIINYFNDKKEVTRKEFEDKFGAGKYADCLVKGLIYEVKSGVCRLL